MRFHACLLASCSFIVACYASPEPIFRRADQSTSILSTVSGSDANTKSSSKVTLGTTTTISSSTTKSSSFSTTSTSKAVSSSSSTTITTTFKTVTSSSTSTRHSSTTKPSSFSTKSTSKAVSSSSSTAITTTSTTVTSSPTVSTSTGYSSTTKLSSFSTTSTSKAVSSSSSTTITTTFKTVTSLSTSTRYSSTTKPSSFSTTSTSKAVSSSSSTAITTTSTTVTSSRPVSTATGHTSSSVSSASSPSQPATIPLTPNQTPTSGSTTTSSAAVATTTVSGGATIIVAAGTVVVGGPGGGFISVGGVVTPVSAGETITAGESTGDDSPGQSNSQQSKSKDEKTSSTPTSTSTSSSSTSSASSQTPTAAIIFPVDTAADGDVTALLDETLGTGNYITSFLTGAGLKFVTAQITASQNKTISASSLISSVVPDGPIDDTPTETPIQTGITRRRTLRPRDLVEQADARTELKRISQIPGEDFDSMTGYSYDDSSGRGITVYVIDTGFGTASDEYKDMGGEPPRWLFADSEKQAASESDESDVSHGSCVGSKVNGPRYGVVKNANLVIVKAKPTRSDTISAMNEVLADILNKNLIGGKAVINISRQILSPRDIVIKFLDLWIATMVKLDVIVVLAAGNEGNIDIDGYPQLLADKYPIINVGAVDETGKTADFSQGGPLATVWAPGVNIYCASGDPSGLDQEIDGTSFAAPAVAGLAAYLLALGEYEDLEETGSIAENMKNIIMAMAYPRITDGEPVAYNGEGAVCEGETSGASRLRRRQSGGSCKASSSSSTTSSTTVASSTSTTTLAPTTTTASTTSSTTVASSTSTTTPATTTTTAPAVTTLFSLDKSVPAGDTACFDTTGFSISPGTYGFNTQVDSSMLVQIQSYSDHGYYQGLGSVTGTFYATFTGELTICANNPGSGTLQLDFAITSAPTTPPAAPAGAEVDVLGGNVRAQTTTCFRTAFAIQRGTYGFSYTIADGVVVEVGDDSSGPIYFSGIGSGSGTMFIDYSGGSLSVCADNSGGSDATLEFTVTQ